MGKPISGFAVDIVIYIEYSKELPGGLWEQKISSAKLQDTRSRYKIPFYFFTLAMFDPKIKLGIKKIPLTIISK